MVIGKQERRGHSAGRHSRKAALFALLAARCCLAAFAQTGTAADGEDAFALLEKRLAVSAARGERRSLFPAPDGSAGAFLVVSTGLPSDGAEDENGGTGEGRPYPVLVIPSASTYAVETGLAYIARMRGSAVPGLVVFLDAAAGEDGVPPGLEDIAEDAGSPEDMMLCYLDIAEAPRKLRASHAGGGAPLFFVKSLHAAASALGLPLEFSGGGLPWGRPDAALGYLRGMDISAVRLLGAEGGAAPVIGAAQLAAMLSAWPPRALAAGAKEAERNYGLLSLFWTGRPVFIPEKTLADAFLVLCALAFLAAAAVLGNRGNGMVDGGWWKIESREDGGNGRGLGERGTGNGD
ncbi:MAG: hypothetical protein MdMp014T_0699 [Treponematales bacterium]